MAVPKNHAVERLRGQLLALTEVSKTLTLPHELPELLDLVLHKIVGVIGPAEIGMVMLWDQSSGLFRPAAACGFDFHIFQQIGLRAGESITGKVYDRGKASLLVGPEEVKQGMADMRPANRAVFARSLGTEDLPLCSLAAPITAGDQRYGILVLETLKGPLLFTDEDIPFVQTIADLVALAIDRARLEAKADAIREARESERLRAELMATLSHQLRMPLTAIKGYTSALLMDDVEWSEEKKRDFLSQAEAECENMEVMIKDILELVDHRREPAEP